MLNIGRMGPRSHRYYLDHVARGAEDYYLGRGEAPGEWLGAGARQFGLDGQVTGDQLSAVLDARDPTTGEVLSNHPARKVPGFDLTFRAPKSVSLLWSLTDQPTSEAVRAAHDRAVAAAVGYLERHAARSRRGAGGTEQVTVDGFVAAGFRHRTSRAQDPLLHTHVLVANLVRASDDGRWRTLDSRRLFTHAKTAGTLYQAHLRAELTRTLGVAWQPVTNGCADLAGVDRDWIEAFSKRRAAIVAELHARGESSAAAAQVATLATRPDKPAQPDEPTLRQRWQDEADRHGVRRGWWQDLLGRQAVAPPDVARLDDQLIGNELLTAESSTFAHQDVLRTIAEHCREGASVEVVESIGQQLLDAGQRDGDVVRLDRRRGGLVEVIRRGDGTIVDAAGEDVQFTTRGLLLLEQTAINAAVARRGQGAGVANEDVLDAVLRRRPTLGHDQQQMVARLTRGGDGVATVVGRAGTGKTFALDAAREAWERTGIRVTGVALAARAAMELEDTAGIPSTTLARLLHGLDGATVGSPLQPGQVLVVDEAGMVGTRPLARLLDHAAHRKVKVVLVGDPRQLPEIDAGGLFVALTRRLPTVELTDNRRQTHPWEHAALDQLRHGSVSHAVAAYAQEGRLVTAETAEEIRERLVSDWWQTTRDQPPGRSIMVALRRAGVADLNARARVRLQAAGLLTGPTRHAGDVDFQAGDRVMCLRNRYPAGMVNGRAATITGICDDGSLEAMGDDSRPLLIPADYIDAGHLTHGYAITGHKAQGLTVDHTFVLGSEALYREWGYVAMSRGRQTNQLYVHARSDLQPDAHVPPPAVAPAAATVSRLRRTRADQPVSDDTAVRWRQLARWLDRDDIRSQPEIASRLDAATRERDRVAARLTALLNEQISWVGPAVRPQTRQHRDQVRATTDRVEARLHGLDDQLRQLHARQQELPTTKQIRRARQEYEQLDLHLRGRALERTTTALTHPPTYLLAGAGVPPKDPAGRARWQQAAYVIERYRLDWDVHDRVLPLGHPPADPLQRRAHAHAHAKEQLQRLTRPPRRDRGRDLGRGIAR